MMSAHVDPLHIQLGHPLVETQLPLVQVLPGGQ
jgi:hypothetical protein